MAPVLRPTERGSPIAAASRERRAESSVTANRPVATVYVAEGLYR